jgi:hypothetical protein
MTIFKLSFVFVAAVNHISENCPATRIFTQVDRESSTAHRQDHDRTSRETVHRGRAAQTLPQLLAGGASQ